MKVLITGAAGQLGQELARQLAESGSVLGPLPAALAGAKVAGVDLPDGNLARPEDANAIVAAHRPNLILHCAAFTAVDRCETETDTAFAANALAPRNMALAAQAAGAALLYLSTDYVFSGRATRPMREDEPTAPVSVYGKTKWLGEQYVQQYCSRSYIVRTAWLYGRRGANFVKTILRLAQTQGQLKVVNDQQGSPTNAEDLAHHLLRIAAGGLYGLYHCTGTGVCSWYEFAAEILRLTGLDAHLEPCSTKEFPRPAPRPSYSALDNAMLRATLGNGMRPWQEALADYLARYSVAELLEDE